MDEPAAMTRAASEAATNVSRHARHLDDLPAYRAVVETWPPRQEQGQKTGRIAVLRGVDGELFLIATRDAQLSAPWFHILDRYNRSGDRVTRILTADHALFEILSYKDPASTADQGVVQSIINDSAPLKHLSEIVGEAIDIGASDIHIEIRGLTGHFSVRVGGVIRKLRSYPSAFLIDAVSAGFTVMAEELSRSDAAFNARLAQQAMIPIDHRGQSYNLRYQSHAAVAGFDVALRILNSGEKQGSARARVLSMTELGYLPSQIEALELAMMSAWGGVFIAGITGSGKTTTLNSMLARQAQRGGQKIISIEDPVEYVVPGVTHLSIQRSNAGGTENPFLNAMRAFLRLDPDVGMFGVIRDQLSGEIAQAAIETGHKIFTTVHATSALGIISRLTSKMIGLDRNTVCSPEFISVLVYQALLPRNCPYCRQPAVRTLQPELLGHYEHLFGIDPERIYCASDAGCDHCRIPGVDYTDLKHAGTRGVCVAAEVIAPDEALLRLLLQGEDMDARSYYRNLCTSAYSDIDMTGKEAWAHALYSLAQGQVDPFHFQSTFGHPKSFSHLARPGTAHGIQS